MPKKLLLIDGHSILNRGFYALPLLTNQAGEYTNAVYGFLNIFLRLYDEENPDYVIVAFDVHHPTFRHQQYTAYKGTRKSMPEELRPQVPLLKQVLATMNIQMAECPGYEADDVLGTLAVQAERAGIQAVIVTGDRDLLQLAGETIKIRIPKTKSGKTEIEDYYAADVLEKLGVSPRAYIDVKALMGDASDNIPGVPGIGEVTATKIIAAYGSLENALVHADEVKPKKASENLTQFQEQALLSKTLATIVLDAPVAFDESTAIANDLWNAEALAEFQRLELKTLLNRFKAAEKPTPKAVSTCRIINTEPEADAFIQELCKQPEAAAFYLIADESILGVGVSTAGQAPTYLHVCETLQAPALLNILQKWFASDKPKLTLDSKREEAILRQHGFPLNAVVFDAMLAGYVLNANKPKIDARDIAHDYLNETLTSLDDLLENKGKRSKDRKTLADLSPEILADYACHLTQVLLRAYPVMFSLLRENDQLSLYEDMELPLARVLADMEQAGIKVDRPALIEYGKALDQQIEALTGAIYEMAGSTFNIQSPAQLGVILFEKLGLKGTKKTTQGWSTAADVLEKLVHKHPIVPLILEYRTFTKLKSTYVEGLLPLINPETSRLHSTFHQALTATGRISSAEPNLQNIPVRMPLGRQLRKVFVPPDEETVFVDADYSQIELRILAHMSGDETLINAFLEGQDIHRLTASQVFHTPPEQVTPEQRSNAKAVNFGIVYGISAFGLSEDLKISKKEAERYIEGYFEKYPRVKIYLDEQIARAKQDGYASTMYNRRRTIPELNSSNFTQRSFGERVAMNMPIQGSAADIIKIAMINVVKRLKREHLQSRLILQVHDELLLEVKKNELETVKALLREEMENAALLKAPLVADVHEGVSWYDAK